MCIRDRRWKGQRTNPLNWLDNDFSTASSAVKLGSYSSVTHDMKEVEYLYYAIDVSKHQGKFDWQAAHSKGIRHAMLLSLIHISGTMRPWMQAAMT